VRLSEILCCAVFCRVQGVMSLFWSGEGELYKPAVCARAGGVVFAQPSKMKCILQTCHRVTVLLLLLQARGVLAAHVRGGKIRGKRAEFAIC